VAAAVASVATEWLVGWASARGVMDRPNERSSHTRATPRGGGISIVAVTAWAVILAAVLWPEARLPLVAFLVPALAIAVVSWLDDLKPLHNRVRFGVHLAAAVAATAVLGPFRSADLGSIGTFELGVAAWPLTLLWIVGMTNAFNFMDGIDGIAGITAAVAGYEVGIRVGEFLGRSHYKVFHTTGTAGTLASAAAVGHLLGLNPAQMQHAFGSAGTQSAGLWEFLRTAADSKQLHTAHAAGAGAQAGQGPAVQLHAGRQSGDVAGDDIVKIQRSDRWCAYLKSRQRYSAERRHAGLHAENPDRRRPGKCRY